MKVPQRDSERAGRSLAPLVKARGFGMTPEFGAQMEMAPDAPEPSNAVVLRHSVQAQYWSEEARSQVTYREIISAFSPR